VISPYIRRLRERVGHELLVLPSVTVLPRDDEGRILLVRLADGGWATIGGSVEPDEAPADAAVREAREEAGVDVVLGPIVAALGGPDFRVRYPNGDETAYVAVVYYAALADGAADPAPDDEETVEVAWVSPEELHELDLGPFARATFAALGLLQARP
jgi:8-oxo-dGTP pyrophosphatase MutT (NUDIX family)